MFGVCFYITDDNKVLAFIDHMGNSFVLAELFMDIDGSWYVFIIFIQTFADAFIQLMCIF